MESARETRPAEAAGAPASKRVQERSKSHRHRRWRKGKAKGERVGAGSSPAGTLDIPWETEGQSGLTLCQEKRETGGLAPCRPARGKGVTGIIHCEKGVM